MPFLALFDANALYGTYARSLIIELTETKLFQAKWTEEILNECFRNILKKNPHISESSFIKIKNQMNEAVPDCLIADYQHLISDLKIPDENDRHVLQAAIKGRVNVIVTNNEKDFPQEILAIFDLHTKTLDEFIMDIIDIDRDLDPNPCFAIIKKDREHYKNPALSSDEYLERLKKSGLKETSIFLSAVKVLI
jgi:predicted nucleic acid-binding protein